MGVTTFYNFCLSSCEHVNPPAWPELNWLSHPRARARVTKKAAVVRDNARYPLVTSDVSRAKHHTRQHVLTDKHHWWGSVHPVSTAHLNALFLKNCLMRFYLYGASLVGLSNVSMYWFGWIVLKVIFIVGHVKFAWFFSWRKFLKNCLIILSLYIGGVQGGYWITNHEERKLPFTVSRRK